MFEIFLDAKQRLVTVQTSGIGTVDSVADFSGRLLTLLEAQHWKAGEFSLIMHALDTLPQPQVVVEAIGLLLVHGPRQPRRIAIVKAGAIAALQTRRLFAGRDARLCATTAEAEAWLREEAAAEGDPDALSNA